MDNKSISYKSLSGSEITNYITEIANLRIKIFREWPYLYDGNLNYEKKYLNRYSSVNKSLIILALKNKEVIGASSCICLSEESDLNIKESFISKGYNLEDVVYFGESILLPEYRGLGVGSYFMKAREEFAKSCDVKYVSFCSVIRDQRFKPDNYKNLDEFWNKKGFIKQENMFCSMSWKDIEHNRETEKNLQFWIKELK